MYRILCSFTHSRRPEETSKTPIVTFMQLFASFSPKSQSTSFHQLSQFYSIHRCVSHFMFIHSLSIHSSATRRNIQNFNHYIRATIHRFLSKISISLSTFHQLSQIHFIHRSISYFMSILFTHSSTTRRNSRAITFVQSSFSLKRYQVGRSRSIPRTCST